MTSLVANPDPTPLAEAFLIYCHTPEASPTSVGRQGPGHVEPGRADGRARPCSSKWGSQEELGAVQWDEEGSWLAKLVGRCVDFDINPDYDAMHDMYTEAKRSRGA